MDGWMDGWMDEWMEQRKREGDGWMDRLMGGSMNGYRLKDEWMNG